MYLSGCSCSQEAGITLYSSFSIQWSGMSGCRSTNCARFCSAVSPRESESVTGDRWRSGRVSYPRWRLRWPGRWWWTGPRLPWWPGSFCDETTSSARSGRGSAAEERETQRDDSNTWNTSEPKKNNGRLLSREQNLCQNLSRADEAAAFPEKIQLVIVRLGRPNLRNSWGRF